MAEGKNVNWNNKYKIIEDFEVGTYIDDYFLISLDKPMLLDN